MVEVSRSSRFTFVSLDTAGRGDILMKCMFHMRERIIRRSNLELRFKTSF